jgi:nitrate/nitrite transporter NarK
VKSALMNGILSAVPYVFYLIALVVAGWHSDRAQERRFHSALPCLSCAVFLVGVGVFAHIPILSLTSLRLALASYGSAYPVFWQIHMIVLAGTGAAAGIALINSIGGLSGWLGPIVVGWLRDLTGKTSSGLYVLASLEGLAALLILNFVPRGEVATSGRVPK